MRRISKKYIGIDKLFQKYSFFQPSSISAERVFSSVTFVYSKSRNKLSPTKVCKIVKIKQNLHQRKKEIKESEKINKKPKKSNE